MTTEKLVSRNTPHISPGVSSSSARTSPASRHGHPVSSGARYLVMMHGAVISFRDRSKLLCCFYGEDIFQNHVYSSLSLTFFNFLSLLDLSCFNEIHLILNQLNNSETKHIHIIILMTLNLQVNITLNWRWIDVNLTLKWRWIDVELTLNWRWLYILSTLTFQHMHRLTRHMMQTLIIWCKFNDK